MLSSGLKSWQLLNLLVTFLMLQAVSQAQPTYDPRQFDKHLTPSQPLTDAAALKRHCQAISGTRYRNFRCQCLDPTKAFQPIAGGHCLDPKRLLVLSHGCAAPLKLYKQRHLAPAQPAYRRCLHFKSALSATTITLQPAAQVTQALFESWDEVQLRLAHIVKAVPSQLQKQSAFTVLIAPTQLTGPQLTQLGKHTLVFASLKDFLTPVATPPFSQLPEFSSHSCQHQCTFKTTESKGHNLVRTQHYFLQGQWQSSIRNVLNLQNGEQQLNYNQVGLGKPLQLRVSVQQTAKGLEQEFSWNLSADKSSKLLVARAALEQLPPPLKKAQAALAIIDHFNWQTLFARPSTSLYRSHPPAPLFTLTQLARIGYHSTRATDHGNLVLQRIQDHLSITNPHTAIRLLSPTELLGQPRPTLWQRTPVVNLSLAITGSPETCAENGLVAAIQASQQTTLWIMAAGNAGQLQPKNLCLQNLNLPNTLVVAAGQDRLAPTSNYGSQFAHVAAPGSLNQHTDATSFAAPLVSLIAWHLRQNFPNLTPAQIKLVLLLSARIPSSPLDVAAGGYHHPQHTLKAAMNLAKSLAAQPLDQLNSQYITPQYIKFITNHNQTVDQRPLRQHRLKTLIQALSL